MDRNRNGRLGLSGTAYRETMRGADSGIELKSTCHPSANSKAGGPGGPDAGGLMKQRDAYDPLISRCSGLMEAEVDTEMVGLHIESGTCYGFNRTAYRIWQLVGQPVRLSQLCAMLSQEFEVDPATCEHEIHLLLKGLEEDGLVTLSEA